MTVVNKSVFKIDKVKIDKIAADHWRRLYTKVMDHFDMGGECTIELAEDLLKTISDIQDATQEAIAEDRLKAAESDEK